MAKIKGSDLLAECTSRGCQFFTGVPDSLLGSFSWACTTLAAPARHVIAANEGNAVGLAAGWWFGRRTVPVVYLQNSGLGNACNPLLSLAHEDVYSIPMLLLIGWRGRPGSEDEGQHRVQGRVTADFFTSAQIPWWPLKDGEGAATAVECGLQVARRDRTPVAVLVHKGVVAPDDGVPPRTEAVLTRTEALRILIPVFARDDAVVGSTGYIARDLYRQYAGGGRDTRQLFLNVGSMGHASQVACGLALAQPERRVWCVDGDGAYLMHMGGSATIAALRPANLIHVILHNGAHASVGGAPTCASDLDIARAGHALGYKEAVMVADADALLAAAIRARQSRACTLIVVRINQREDDELGRPPEPLKALGRAFEDFLSH